VIFLRLLFPCLCGCKSAGSRASRYFRRPRKNGNDRVR